MKQIHPGSIILLHTVSKDNAEALDHAIEELRKQGYTFKSLDDLMINKMMDHPYLLSFDAIKGFFLFRRFLILK